MPRKRKICQETLESVAKSIEKFPTYGYRRLAFLLKRNRKVIQRILQIKGWQVRKRQVGKRPRVLKKKSAATVKNQRWAIDNAMIWCGKDRWCHLTGVIDCATRELIGWRLSPRGNAKTAHAALEEALINQFGHVGRISGSLTLRSDNGLVFTSRHFTSCVKSYGIKQEFIEPHRPDQNGIIERFFRSLKEECVWQYHFESLAQATHIIGQYIRYYNMERPHQSLGYRTPAESAFSKTKIA